MIKPSPGDSGRKQKIINLAMAALVGQVGCLTLVIILVALFGGLYLDNRFGSKPWFTLVLTLGSIPVSLGVMLYVSRAAVRKIKTQAAAQEEQEIGSQK
jgi:F0F1-type ATP synthase assembly protein I